MTVTENGSVCSYPQLGPTTGYRYGCRCPRCSEAHRRPLPAECQHPGCTEARQKGRRYCPDHHSPGRSPKGRSKVVEAPCELCQRPHTWYESVLARLRPELADLYRRVCSDCRGRYSHAIKNHRLNADQAIRLITATHCDLCEERLATDGYGRRKVEVDHDHAHCSGGKGCHQCIRGFLCGRCNYVVGVVETTLMVVGYAKVMDYLDPGF